MNSDSIDNYGSKLNDFEGRKISESFSGAEEKIVDEMTVFYVYKITNDTVELNHQTECEADERFS